MIEEVVDPGQLGTGGRNILTGVYNIISTIDFVNQQNIPAFVASWDSMKAYDRAPNGEITFIFDEAANAPKELLKGIYEITRAAVATGFSDGKPRPMKNVTIILTGNAGEEIYQNIPTNLPSDAQEKALHEVYKIFIEDEDLQKRILARTNRT